MKTTCSEAQTLMKHKNPWDNVIHFANTPYGIFAGFDYATGL